MQEATANPVRAAAQGGDGPRIGRHQVDRESGALPASSPGEKIPIDLIAASSGREPLRDGPTPSIPTSSRGSRGFSGNYWKPEIFRDFRLTSGLLVSLLRPRRRPIENFGLIKGRRICRTSTPVPRQDVRGTAFRCGSWRPTSGAAAPSSSKRAAWRGRCAPSVSLPLYMRAGDVDGYLLWTAG